MTPADLLDRFPSQKIVVVGDLVADEFVYGEIARVSREAPVLILRHERTETMPGGAGNTAANIASLGATAASVGIVGRDRAGRMITLALRGRNILTDGVVAVPKHVTPTKTRILAGTAHAPRQQVIRVDRETAGGLTAEIFEKLATRLRKLLHGASGVILSDYGYGVTADPLIGIVREWHAATGGPVVVDSRHRLAEFHGLTAATPNQEEAETLAGTRFDTLDDALSATERLRERFGFSALLLTRGPDGMVLAQNGASPLAVEAIGSKEPVDVTGAGDTVIATFTTALAAGAGFEAAMDLANRAAGLVVMKRGTATVSREELLARMDK